MLDFANELDAAVCWYQIARGDEDLLQFARYLTAALRQKFKRFGPGLENLLNVPGGVLNPQSLATAMVNEIVAQVDDFCVLFLDDFHIVGEMRAISEFLEAFLDYLPDQLRIVIASRSVYGIPTAKLYIRSQIATVGVEDLRFRPDEIAELVRQNFKTTIPPAYAEDLAKRSDGWVVAILLSMQSLSQGRTLSTEGFTAEQVYTFLAQEVIERESDALQGFMLATSIQDEFSEPFVSYLLEMEKSTTQTLLQELERRNLFISRIETAAGVAYRYHQLFLDFLQDRLVKTDPVRRRHLHHRAAAWHRDRAAWERAVAHQLAAGNRPEAAAWMDAEARNFYVTGQAQILSDWVDALAETPDLHLLAPRLLLNWAKVLIERGEYTTSEQFLDLAEPVLRQRGEGDQVINLLIARGGICYMQGHFEETYQLAQTILRLLTVEPTHEEAALMHLAEGQWLNGISLAAKGDFQAAIEFVQQAVQGFRRLFETLQDETLKVHVLYSWGRVLNDLGVISYESGNILAAQTYSQETLRVRKKNRSNLLGLAESLNNIGYLYFQTGAYASAWHTYQEAIEILKPIKPGSVHIHLYNSMGDLLCALEEWQMAEEMYQQAIHVAKDSQMERALFATYWGLSQISLARQQYSAAMEWLREAALVRKLSEAAPLYQEKLGQIYMEMGQMKLAFEAFEQALKQWETLERPRLELVQAAFFFAQVLFLQNERERALTHLQTALAWAARLGFDQFLVLAGRRAHALLTYASETWPAHRQLQGLWIRVQAFQPGLAQLLPPAQPEDLSAVHLEISALGPGQVRRDGKLITKAAWQSGKPRALFFYLVERGHVRASDIKLDFWPEFNTSRATTNLQATLWRARNAFENKDIIINQDEEYALAAELDIWYDVAEFRNYLSQAVAPSITPFERAEYWRRAVDLYQGDYLADILMEWAETIRRDLLESYLEALLNLARWETSKRRYTQAIRYYEKALEKEPFEDTLHREVMACWVSAGSIASAKAHFSQYQKKMQKEGLVPSQALLEYYETLVKGRRAKSTKRKK